MSDLVEFLNARLYEDERAAREACRYDDEDAAEWDIEYQWARHARHKTAGGGRHWYAHGAPTPARVLREVEAKRRIIGLHSPGSHVGDIMCLTCAEDDGYGGLRGDWPCDTAKLLALPHADHPDYREEWKPKPLT